jgi:lysophospholipase L1-like esterase
MKSYWVALSILSVMNCASSLFSTEATATTEFSSMQNVELARHPDLVAGAVKVDAVEGATRFLRLPPSLYELFSQHESSRIRAYSTTGVRIRFRSNTRVLRLSARYGDAISWTRKFAFDLEVDGELKSTFGSATGEKESIWQGEIFQADESKERELVLWLPHLCEVQIERLEIEKGATLRPVASTMKWVALGDSITQGFVTSRPAETYPARVARALNLDLYNMAVGGSVTDANLAAAAKTVDADLITIAHGINDYISNKDAATEATRVAKLLLRLRHLRPHAAIVWITPIPYHTMMDEPNKAGLKMADYTRIIREQAQKVGGVSLIDGSTLVPDEAQWFVDNAHPNERGHELYARNLVVQLKRLMNVGTLPPSTQLPFAHES